MRKLLGFSLLVLVISATLPGAASAHEEADDYQEEYSSADASFKGRVDRMRVQVWAGGSRWSYETPDESSYGEGAWADIYLRNARMDLELHCWPRRGEAVFRMTNSLSEASFGGDFEAKCHTHERDEVRGTGTLSFSGALMGQGPLGGGGSHWRDGDQRCFSRSKQRDAAASVTVTLTAPKWDIALGFEAAVLDASMGTWVGGCKHVGS